MLTGRAKGETLGSHRGTPSRSVTGFCGVLRTMQLRGNLMMNPATLRISHSELGGFVHHPSYPLPAPQLP
eukprot:7578631-Lingulodinium_polyedra.AAC.1